MPKTGITYTATAINVADSTETYEAVCEDNSASYYVRIPSSETEKHFTVKATASYNGLLILSGQSDVFTIDSVNGTAVQDVMLKALKTETGKGIVKLQVYTDTDAGITSARMILTDSDGVSVTKNASVSDFVFTFEQGSVSNGVMTDGVKSGSAGVRFEFYSGSNCTGTLCYSFEEVLNILDNMTTDSWVKTGSENHFEFLTDASGNVTTKCHITKEMVKDAALKKIWVDPNRQTTNTSLTTYTTGTGTFLNPCVSLSAALGKLQNKDLDYTIYIKGTLTGAQEIPSSLKSDGTGTTNAHSLTLCGATGVNESGIPQDVIDGNNANNTALKINTTVPVKIQNLKITKGKGTNGGGIHLVTGGSLVLDSGTLVDGNSASSYYSGGGVYITGTSTLTMQGNAKVSNNTSSGGDGGGGIICYGNGTKLILKDNACITGNRGSRAGGIATVDTTNGFYMSDSVKIYSNTGTGSDSQGGGIRLWNTKLYMTGGSIYSNTSKKGGGIYLQNNSNLIMSGGVIGGTTSAEKNTASVKGNGLYIVGTDEGQTASNFHISENAFVTENNEVYLTEGAKVTVNGKLTPPASFESNIVTTIQPLSYINQLQVLDIASEPNPSTTLAKEFGHFSVTPDASTPSVNWFINSSGLLVQAQTSETVSSYLSGITANTTSTPYNVTIKVSSQEEFEAVKAALKANSSKYVNITLLCPGITTLPDSALNGCTSIVGITYPEGITSVGEFALAGCSNLSSLVLSNTITATSYRDLNGCYSLTSLTLPESLITIGTQSLNSIGITSITIPKNVKTIASDAFCNSSSLTDITVVPENQYWKDIDGVLYRKDGTELLCCPAAKTGALIIQDGVKKIRGWSVYTAKITSVKIPASVTTIEQSAFEYCSRMATITFEGTMAQWNNISKGSDWIRKSSVPATVVHCSDGDVDL